MLLRHDGGNTFKNQGNRDGFRIYHLNRWNVHDLSNAITAAAIAEGPQLDRPLNGDASAAKVGQRTPTSGPFATGGAHITLAGAIALSITGIGELAADRIKYFSIQTEVYHHD
jgi:hypothetical protein